MSVTARNGLEILRRQDTAVCRLSAAELALEKSEMHLVGLLVLAASTDDVLSCYLNKADDRYGCEAPGFMCAAP